ncbi:MAG: D-alanyl-D-alanine carboxypeptidase [Clostridia bacterium]|nr:D-alanyl-D-alanine carboxypeptidase [Clostridia bacterium]
MKRIFILFLALVIICFNVVNTKAQVSVSANSAIVIDCASKRVLFEKNAYTKRGMASTTKIMTALICIEKLDFDEIVTVSPHAAGTEGSSIWLSPGEKISVEDLLYGLLLSSGNDAATALAEHTAGSVAAFVQLMNRRARDIGAYNTNFTNPHGLPDDNHYTTAYDLAIITAEAMNNERFSQIVATKNKTISWEGSQWDRSLSNHNKLLKMYDAATGVKTGFTKKDGRCLVSAAEKNGIRLVGVTLSAPDDWNDHINMLNYCYEKYQPYTVCTKGESAGIFADKTNNAEDIALVFKSDYITVLNSDEQEKISTKKVLKVNYPVFKGDTVGRCDVYLSENLIGSVDIIAANDSDIKNDFLTVFIKLAKGILKT